MRCAHSSRGHVVRRSRVAAGPYVAGGLSSDCVRQALGYALGNADVVVTERPVAASTRSGVVNSSVWVAEWVTYADTVTVMYMARVTEPKQASLTSGVKCMCLPSTAAAALLRFAA